MLRRTIVCLLLLNASISLSHAEPSEELRKDRAFAATVLRIELLKPLLKEGGSIPMELATKFIELPEAFFVLVRERIIVSAQTDRRLGDLRRLRLKQDLLEGLLRELARTKNYNYPVLEDLISSTAKLLAPQLSKTLSFRQTVRKATVVTERAINAHLSGEKPAGDAAKK
ncbi:hypothetical protein EB061_10550 [bacterium]|nr:hypothetical protein [bacterium]